LSPSGDRADVRTSREVLEEIGLRRNHHELIVVTSNDLPTPFVHQPVGGCCRTASMFWIQ